MIARIIKPHENSESGHYFNIGEIVELVGIEADDEYGTEFIFTNGKKLQHLFESEFEVIE